KRSCCFMSRDIRSRAAAPGIEEPSSMTTIMEMPAGCRAAKARSNGLKRPIAAVVGVPRQMITKTSRQPSAPTVSSMWSTSIMRTSRLRPLDADPDPLHRGNGPRRRGPRPAAVQGTWCGLLALPGHGVAGLRVAVVVGDAGAAGVGGQAALGAGALGHVLA